LIKNEDLLYEVRDRAAFMTINRESKRNAISQEMISAFLEYLDEANLNDEIHAVCITNTGQKVFCSGADLATNSSGKDGISGARNYAKLLKKLARFSKPVLARVNGDCLAGGLGLMLSCDIVIAREDVFFSTPEVNVGLFPMMVGALLYRDAGRKKITDMVLTGRRVPAHEAEQIGLITRAVAPDKLDNETSEILRQLTSKSPIGIRIGKEAFRTMSHMPFEEAVDHLCGALEKIISTEDAKEGMAAFIEKRKPKFKGK